ncbi:MAG: sulfatase-like hydrolase/transferase [Chitinophagaceae bacterium]|nr:sulfatase-like hydrolase/transferase [Chitinophagaceae bacterium]
MTCKRIKSFYFLLLPLFFVFNGYRQHYPVVPVMDILQLLLVYTFASLIIFFLLLWLFKKSGKAAFGTFILLSVHFFFGSAHDFLRNIFTGSFIPRYSFILPVLILLIIFFFYLLKRKDWQLTRISFYLTALLTILLVIEIPLLFFTIKKQQQKKLLSGNFNSSFCADCPRPDVYLIVADEYAGNETLGKNFGFQNTSFIDALQERGFVIVQNSSSNYNSTPFSVASLLNMDYLSDIKGNHRVKKDVQQCYELINENRVARFFKGHGYAIHNNSIFRFSQQAAVTDETFIPSTTSFITSQTLLNRIEEELGYHLVHSLNLKKFLKKINLKDLKNNEKIISLTTEIASQKKGRSKFVYTHLMMPHYPYYFNKEGLPYDWQNLEQYNADRERYIQYLQFCNTKFVGLIDHIIKNSPLPPIIVFISDHGFRQTKNPSSISEVYNNFNAVLLPDRNYAGFYSNISLVNQFRVVLNTSFRQQFPMLKDSTVFISNEYEK